MRKCTWQMAVSFGQAPNQPLKLAAKGVTGKSQKAMNRQISLSTLKYSWPQLKPNENLARVSYCTTDQDSVKPKQTGRSFAGLEQQFPCLLKNPSSGPEPEYHKVVSGYKTFVHSQPFYLRYNKCVLPEVKIAYETWGELNADRSNAILLAAGLSASSHAKSHADNEKPGWWEKFIGPGMLNFYELPTDFF